MRLLTLFTMGTVLTTGLVSGVAIGASPAAANDPLRLSRIVSMGDGVAAGEGARGPNGWQDSYCHRSELSGVNRTVARLQANLPHGHVIQHLNVTCANTGIRNGILERWGNAAQISQVNGVYGAGTIIDALTIGSGANDAGYSAILARCGDFWDIDCDQTSRGAMNNGIDLMRERYRQLVTAVQGEANGAGRMLNATVRDVFVTTYPDPTKRGPDWYCNDNPWYDGVMGNIFTRESRLLSEMITRMNQVIREAVAAANSDYSRGFLTRWHVVERHDWDNHGWCADAPWIHHEWSGYTAQEDYMATGFPNVVGHEALGDAMFDMLSYINNPLPNGYGFKLVSQHSQRPIGLRGDDLVQGGSAEAFEIRPGGFNGSVQIVSRSTGKCVWNASWLGAYLQLATCQGAAGERWKMIPRPYGAWTIESDAYPGGCVDLAGSSTDPGAQIVRWTCHQAWNQLWWISVV